MEIPVPSQTRLHRTSTIRWLAGAALFSVPLSAMAPTHPGKVPAPVGARSGTVAGTVHLSAVPANAPPRLSPYSQPRYRPQAAPAPTSSVEDVVIYVASDGSTTAARTAAVITQRQQQVIPRVTAVQVGTEVRFPNDDDVFHNLFSLSGPKRFNLGRYPPGRAESVVFDKPGVVKIFCDIHSEMSAVVLVVDTPFFTRPAADGSYQIPNLPPGTHTLVAWHERTAPDTVVVTLADGGVTKADFSLGGGGVR
jgi:plastocyanin